MSDSILSLFNHVPYKSLANHWPNPNGFEGCDREAMDYAKGILKSAIDSNLWRYFSGTSREAGNYPNFTRTLVYSDKDTRIGRYFTNLSLVRNACDALKERLGYNCDLGGDLVRFNFPTGGCIRGILQDRVLHKEGVKEHIINPILTGAVIPTLPCLPPLVRGEYSFVGNLVILLFVFEQFEVIFEIGLMDTWDVRWANFYSLGDGALQVIPFLLGKYYGIEMQTTYPFQIIWHDEYKGTPIHIPLNKFIQVVPPHLDGPKMVSDAPVKQFSRLCPEDFLVNFCGFRPQSKTLSDVSVYERDLPFMMPVMFYPGMLGIGDGTPPDFEGEAEAALEDLPTHIPGVRFMIDLINERKRSMNYNSFGYTIRMDPGNLVKYRQDNFLDPRGSKLPLELKYLINSEMESVKDSVHVFDKFLNERTLAKLGVTEEDVKVAYTSMVDRLPPGEARRKVLSGNDFTIPDILRPYLAQN